MSRPSRLAIVDFSPVRTSRLFLFVKFAKTDLQQHKLSHQDLLTVHGISNTQMLHPFPEGEGLFVGFL